MSTRRQPRSTPNVRSLLLSLEKIRYRFDPATAAARTHLLRQLRSRPIPSAELLKSYHDLLAFHRAYPDNAASLALVEKELRGFERRVRLLWTSRAKGDHPLEDTGIAGTPLSHPFSYDLCRSLVRWYPGRLEIDDVYCGKKQSEALSNMLPLLVSWQEVDTLDNDLTLDTRDWLKLARKGTGLTELELLLKLLAGSGLSGHAQRNLFDNAELVAKWSLVNCSASRTLRRVPHRRLYFQKEPLAGRSADLRSELARPAAPLTLLTPRAGEYYVRAINEILAVRVRELFSISNANPNEVYRYEPGRGVQIFLFGTNPEIRLPIEANFGAMLIRNGLPIGYGVGAVLFDRVEIAINIFPAFRAGESAFIIQEFFRCFHHHFGSNVLLVRSRQVGEGDEEPIRSGAFWFYHKLGFRPVRTQIRALAEREKARLARHPGSRSTPTMLRRLSHSDIFFHFDLSRMSGFRELSLARLGKVVTRLMRDRYRNDRFEADSETTTTVMASLGIRQLERWSRDEMIALIRLAPLLSAISDLRHWSRAEKRELVEIIRAKGGPHERQFVLACNRHPRFRAALERLDSQHRD